MAGTTFDDEERREQHESLRESIRQRAGQTVDAAAALAELRAHR